MFKSKTKPKLLWIPKVLSILYITILIWFSLDAFSKSISFFEQTIQFLIHMVPVFILIGVLVIAWNRPKLGGIFFFSTSLIMTLFLNTFKDINQFLAISFPLFLISILFLVFGFIDEHIH